MISSLEDVRSAISVVNAVKADLNMTDAHIPIGIMVEIPSAAVEIDKLLPEVDFASIGTNDLIQYTLAVDRNNEKVAAYYQPLNGAILALIEKVIQAGDRLNREISVCGEMAGDPHYVPLLIALGVRNLSMHPAALPRVKNLLIKMSDEVIGHLKRNYKKFATINLIFYLQFTL